MKKFQHLEKLLYKLEKSVHSDTPALWGKMNAHQMIEHLSLVFVLSIGKINFPYPGTEEDAKRYWESFLQSENPWREVFPPSNTGDPRSPRNSTIEKSKALLRRSFQDYLNYCEANPNAIHPQYYLGNLTVDQWRQVHVKHYETPYAAVWDRSVTIPRI